MSNLQEFNKYENFTGFKKFIDTCHLLQRYHSPKSKKNYSKSFHRSSTDKKSRKKLQHFQLRRTSSFDFMNICEHCEHHHNQTCCMYVFDDFSDIERYSLFKKEVDKPYWFCSDSDEFDFRIGGTTPYNFPNFSENDQEILNKKETNFNGLAASNLLHDFEHCEESIYRNRFFFNPYFEYYKYLLGNYLKNFSERRNYYASNCELCDVWRLCTSFSTSLCYNYHFYDKHTKYQISDTNSWAPW